MFVKPPPPVPEYWRDFWMLVDELGDRPPTSPCTADTLDEWLHLVGRGDGDRHLPGGDLAVLLWPEVAFVPLRDAAPARMVLARRADAEDRLIREFTELAMEIARTATSNERTPYRPPA